MHRSNYGILKYSSFYFALLLAVCSCIKQAPWASQNKTTDSQPPEPGTNEQSSSATKEPEPAIEVTEIENPNSLDFGSKPYKFGDSTLNLTESPVVEFESDEPHVLLHFISEDGVNANYFGFSVVTLNDLRNSSEDLSLKSKKSKTSKNSNQSTESGKSQAPNQGGQQEANSNSAQQSTTPNQSEQSPADIIAAQNRSYNENMTAFLKERRGFDELFANAEGYKSARSDRQTARGFMRFYAVGSFANAIAAGLRFATFDYFMAGLHTFFAVSLGKRALSNAKDVGKASERKDNAKKILTMDFKMTREERIQLRKLDLELYDVDGKPNPSGSFNRETINFFNTILDRQRRG